MNILICGVNYIIVAVILSDFFDKNLKKANPLDWVKPLTYAFRWLSLRAFLPDGAGFWDC